MHHLRQIALLFVVAGCGTPANNMLELPDQTAAQPDMTSAPMCQHVVSCTDQSVQRLELKRTENIATVGNMSAGGVFTSNVDASAGGATPSKSYVYAKFTSTGLMRVAVGDEDAFTSMDWDIAFRRYVVRLNSGVSGPSCVTAVRTATGTTFDGLTANPTGLVDRTESYFGPAPTCDFVGDGGIGGPATALASFWEYPGCVQMTGNIFVLTLADGKHVKLQVMSYYSPAVQMMCDTTGTVDLMSPTGSGSYVVKWAFLP